jgi:hypothetical protein
MLKNRYQEILVGLNMMSLLRGLISLKRGHTTLLIDDKRFEAESYPGSFVTELEVSAYLRLGKKYDIPELLNIREFLSPASIEFVTDNVRLRIGKTPFENLRELLRKFPELTDTTDLDVIYSEGEKIFDNHFMSELNRYESLSFESSMRPKGFRFEILGPKWFKGIYHRFSELINAEYSYSKNLKYAGLLHLMGIENEEKLKTRLAPEEIPFYFFRLLSPVYRLQDFFLMTQLKRRLSLLGGDYKESMVQYWQLHNGKFENLLLASFEGVISGNRVLFFSHLPEEVPFQISSIYPFYRKTQMAPQKRTAMPYPPTNLTFMTEFSSLGSDLPYRTLAYDKEELAYYHLPYLEMPGSKAEFYDRSLSESFDCDAQNLPFEKKGLAPSASHSVSLDLRQLRDHRKSESPILTRLPLEITQNDEPIVGFEYWGPFRYRSLGILALCYGVEDI